MNYFWIAQIIGILTVITTAFGLFQKEKFKTMICFMVSNLTMMATYFFLDRWLSLILVGIAMVRTFVYYLYAVKNKNPNNIVFAGFEVALIIVAIILWKDYLDLLMLINLCLVTYTTWQDDMKILRIGYIVSSILLLTYDIMVQAYVSAISETILLISSIIAFVKYNVINKIDNIVLTFYQAISNMYEINIEKKSNYYTLYSNKIDDVYNNFILVEDFSNLKNIKRKILNTTRKLNKKAAIYIEAKQDDEIGYIMEFARKNKLLYHDVWMKLRTGYNPDNKKCLLNDVEYRSCSEKDKKDIIKIFDKGFVHQLGDNIYKYSEQYIKTYEEKITKDFIDNKNVVPYMAYYQNKPIALLMLYRKGTNAFLCQITTLNQYRRKRVATHLIQYAISCERKMGIEDFYLVTEKYTWLEIFYMKNNFQEISEGFCIEILSQNKRKK